MKKTFFCIKSTVITVMLFSLFSCGSDKPVLNIYNWGDYIDESVISDFEKEFEVKVNYELFASNEEMYVKIKQGGGKYDLACPSDYMIERMINEDLLSPLDKANIPNMKLIGESFLNLPFDKGNQYSIPYMWGTLGILYNSDKISDPVDSWDVLWDKKYSGKIGMYNSSRDSFAVALKKLGFSLNSTNTGEIEQAKNLLIEQKPLVLAYGEDNLKDMLASGEIDLALAYSGDYGWIIEENPQMAYRVPDEGSNIWFDNWVILKNTANKELAEKFINFMCREDIALRNADYIGYATPIPSVRDQLDDEVKNDEAIYPPQAVVEKCEVYVDLKDFNEVVDHAWTEIKASN
ncbi:ABC transporter substrate-binding protein [Spirochaeta isovalerica]|uniref:Spermidine/putrescine transport system substrate-binding protein n=1 Tax=Spirochaeta isovalerica TaxID=150 RepID=A0A841RFL1_9SPIO|nr:spermidine/putrescine ABC transporter substrate-binding protein [Spirochaeta isovalerica]MBB6481358.1 spermidine/putrescine transport system substrate-binding protein [Spirochaeta isovalerica]